MHVDGQKPPTSTDEDLKGFQAGCRDSVVRTKHVVDAVQGGGMCSGWSYVFGVEACRAEGEWLTSSFVTPHLGCASSDHKSEYFACMYLLFVSCNRYRISLFSCRADNYCTVSTFQDSHRCVVIFLTIFYYL